MNPAPHCRDWAIRQEISEVKEGLDELRDSHRT